MTKTDHKAAERNPLLHFLDRWREGAEWQFVEDPTNIDRSSYLLQRVDGSETVGVEMRRTSLETIARTSAVTEQITEELQYELRVAHIDWVGAVLFFHNASALALGRSEERRIAVARIAQLIKERLPLVEERDVIISPWELAAAGVHAVNVVLIFPTYALAVFNSGGPAPGDDFHIVQPYIDENSRRLLIYRRDATTRSAVLRPSARFAGVWLVLTLTDDPGLSRSTSSTQAELRREGFDRAFLLDHWETERRVIELLG